MTRSMEWRGRKGRLQMSGQSKFSQNVIAVVAALMMSSVTVGAALVPAQAGGAPVEVMINA